MNVLLILFSDILPHRSSKTVLKEINPIGQASGSCLQMRHRGRITPILVSLAAMWRYEIASRSQAITTMEMKNTQECVVLMRGVGRLPKSSDPQMSRK